MTTAPAATSRSSTATVRALNVTPRLLGNDPYRWEDLHEYIAAGGYGTGITPADLLERIDATGLRGRGGAGFPLGTKLRTVREQGGTPIVVANGEEGEPGSVKDRHLMRTRPHLILDGLAHAAAIVGAKRGYAYVSDPASAASIRRALAEKPQPIMVVEVDPTYVAGEETAVVRFLNGGTALPVAKPPRPYERGVRGVPTLVSNVETLAHVALLAAGVDATDQLLMTISTRDTQPVLIETSTRTALGDLYAAAGCAGATGALLGGMFGGLIATDDGRAAPTDRTPTDRMPTDRMPTDRMTIDRTPVGNGAIYLLSPDDCPIDVAADALAYLGAESSRQCGVCVSGTRSLADAVAALRDGIAGEPEVANIARWAASLPGRGACGLLDAAARIAGSLGRHFESLVWAHVSAHCRECSASLRLGGGRFTVAPAHISSIPARRTP
jgi:NADH:ubiquinone oxidoreductase subunit F (NADH-binding)